MAVRKKELVLPLQLFTLYLKGLKKLCTDVLNEVFVKKIEDELGLVEMLYLFRSEMSAYCSSGTEAIERNLGSSKSILVQTDRHHE